MSESEIMSAFHSYLGLTTDLLFGYISVMSGFLIMSYLVADKLHRLLAAIVVGLFSAVSADLAFRIFLNRNDMNHIVEYLLKEKAAGNVDLPWWGFNPPWASAVLTYVEILAIVGGFVGCIVFFFYQRRTKGDDS